MLFFFKSETAKKIAHFFTGMLFSVFLVVIFFHFTSSIWIAVGRPNSVSEVTWYSFIPNYTFNEATFKFGDNLVYFNSFYFNAMTLSTVGYGNILPIKNEEMLLSMALCFLGIVFFGYGLGQISYLLAGFKSKGLLDQIEVTIFLEGKRERERKEVKEELIFNAYDFV